MRIIILTTSLLPLELDNYCLTLVVDVKLSKYAHSCLHLFSKVVVELMVNYSIKIITKECEFSNQDKI